jgi:CheY-like chemotaxis protein
MKKILFAEDNPTGRELLRELLESWGYEVREAVDGAEVLQKVKDSLPDLVLLDIQMPVLDGYAVLKFLRSEQGLRNLPVIALTAFAMDGDQEKARTFGFDGYHSKPLSAKVLKNEIERLLAKAG